MISSDCFNLFLRRPAPRFKGDPRGARQEKAGNLPSFYRQGLETDVMESGSFPPPTQLLLSLSGDLTACQRFPNIHIIDPAPAIVATQGDRAGEAAGGHLQGSGQGAPTQGSHSLVISSQIKSSLVFANDGFQFDSLLRLAFFFSQGGTVARAWRQPRKKYLTLL